MRPGLSTFAFSVDANGNVSVPSRSNGTPAEGGEGSLTLKTQPVTIYPDAFAGKWWLDQGVVRSLLPNMETVHLVPNIK